MSIRRRDVIFGSGALCALGAFSGGLAAGLGSAGSRNLPPRRPPNIIFLLADDMRWDAMGWMGNPYIRTPSLDALAARSFCFQNNFVTTSICSISRACFLTGQYARRHGIWDFDKPLSQDALRQTFPWLLKQAGYSTCFIGKWGVGENLIHLAQFMYDYYDAFSAQGEYFFGDRPGQHLTDLQADSAIRYIKSVPADKPFCLQISFKAPHGPFTPASRFEDFYRTLRIPRFPTDTPQDQLTVPASVADSRSRFRWNEVMNTDENAQNFVKSYYRLVSGIDQTVGRLVSQLEEMGLADNTCIIFSSDNGYMIGEHGLWGKWLMYEESIRVPMFMHIPAALRIGQPQRRMIEEISLNIDTAPTILALAGLTPPPRMQGTSLLPLIYQQQPNWREEFFYEHHFNSPPYKITACVGVRTKRWKYARYEARDDVLFDLQNDPLEQRNVANLAEHREIITGMQARMIDYTNQLV